MPDIECRTAESMVTKYINHSLSVDELEEFLDHISHCSSCYDELETYFIVHEAIQQLDEPEDGSVLDFRKLLDQDIRKSRRYIRKKRWFPDRSFAGSICDSVAYFYYIFYHGYSAFPINRYRGNTF